MMIHLMRTRNCKESLWWAWARNWKRGREDDRVYIPNTKYMYASQDEIKMAWTCPPMGYGIDVPNSINYVVPLYQGNKINYYLLHTRYSLACSELLRFNFCYLGYSHYHLSQHKWMLMENMSLILVFCYWNPHYSTKNLNSCR